MYIYANMLVLKLLAQNETCSMHEQDYVELIRMKADMLVLKHLAETSCTHEEDYAELIRMFNECRYVGVETRTKKTMLI
jgi:hypothetical protein